MNIVILMAGASLDFVERGHYFPKYLLEYQNEPIIKHVIELLCGVQGGISFVIRKEDNEKYFLSNTLKILAPNSNVIFVENLTKGALCSVLYAMDAINKEDEELLILNGDQLIKENLNDIINCFRSQGLDGGIVVFQSVHPRWNYVLLNEENLVVQTSEKRPISNLATAGCYYYKSGFDFIRAGFRTIRKDANYQGNYYVSSTYNELILDQKKIGIYEIPKESYLSFSSYQMYESYLNNQKK